MRKNIFVFLAACSFHFAARSQYWQQEVDFIIDVTLNDKEHTLDGFEKIHYTNNSSDTLHFIWFHIWPNAYKNDKTAFSDQFLENGSTAFYFSNREQKGYINRLDFKVDNVTASFEDHPEHIDIIRLILPAPLPPGHAINISTPFHVKLPFNYSRGGHDRQSYQLTQWFPKPAVYDRKGWHPMPYLDQGEFYNEFGDFDVRISVPAQYVVAATGVLQNEDEIRIQKGELERDSSTTGVKTLRYLQNNIHDFAWFANRDFIVNYDTCRLASGKIIDVYTYYTPAESKNWGNSVQFCKDAIRSRSAWIGEYPYDIVSAVQGPASFGGGMEYPTITVISPMDNSRLLEYTLAHEIGHNWFYGILASNERAHPWMDEGMNTYYDNRYSQWKFGDRGEIAIGTESVPVKNLEKIAFETMAVEKLDQPINTRSDQFSNLNYGLVAYYKAGAWMEHLESIIGRDQMDKAMQEYYRRWQFRHPYPEDFKQTVSDITGTNLDAVFGLLDKKGLLPGRTTGGWKFTTPFSMKNIADYIKNPSKNLLLISPAVGLNKYDKFMGGILLTNYKLPPTKLQFLAIPMYSTGAKTFTGLGKLSYSFYPEQFLRKVNIFLNASTFSMADFTTEEGQKTVLAFRKIVPGIRLTANRKNPRSQTNAYLQWKTFLITEDEFRFSLDSIINPGVDTAVVTVVGKEAEDRVLNQLKLVVENSRVLYPYSGQLNIEQGKSFVRAGFTGNYYFNYPKEGGLDLRFFAGKFFYTSSKTFSKEFETARYHINMTGPNGYEDYTYSDFFAGRNEFEGFASQQIMMRDGGFKVRTDLLAQKVGRTDDWLIAANLNTTIPSGLNPLSLLPVKIPLRIFVDIGTYGEAWEKDAEGDRFLFDAGLHIPLFNETLNFYLPIIYSKVYKDYIQSTIEKKGRIWKTVSFTIDISNFNLNRISRNIAF